MPTNVMSCQEIRAQAGPLKVLLLDDYRLARQAVRAVLVELLGAMVVDGDIDGEAIRLLRSTEPDIVLVSISRTHRSGLDLIQRLLGDRLPAKVLAFADRAHPDLARRAMAMGASGCISKTAIATELVRAVHKIRQGESYLEPDIAGSLAFAELAGTVDVVDGLTEHEREFLRFIAEGKTLKEIAAIHFAPYKTTANTCARMKAKFDAKSMAELVAIACELNAARTSC